MPEASPNGTETELALAVTQGVPAAKWARTTGVPSITAWRWAKGPVVALRGPAGQAGPRAENREWEETVIF